MRAFLYLPFSILTAYSVVIYSGAFSLSLRICLFISFMNLDVLMGELGDLNTRRHLVKGRVPEPQGRQLLLAKPPRCVAFVSNEREDAMMVPEGKNERT